VLAEGASRSGFAVRLDVYEGPLDLLLALIERRELDISVVSLVAVTDQFLVYLEERAADLDEIAAYLVVAAKLLLIKSIRLLPASPTTTTDAEERVDALDAAAALARQLQDYQRFKVAAAALREREERGIRVWPRRVPPAPATARRLALHLPAEGLRRLLLAIGARQPPSVSAAPPRVTVADQIALIRRLLPRQGALSFQTAIGPQSTVEAIVAGFLAILELARLGELDIEQSQPFGEILLRRRPSGAPSSLRTSSPEGSQ
jgi:segregation and condensation protein A